MLAPPRRAGLAGLASILAVVATPVIGQAHALGQDLPRLFERGQDPGIRGMPAAGLGCRVALILVRGSSPRFSRA